MIIGTLVREVEADPNWQMYPGEEGVVIGSGDAAMGMTPAAQDAGRFWTVRFAGGDMIFLDVDLEIVSESR
ncbi:MAG: hypothetical protein H8E12_08940 [Rhodobacteraceae bacterium]|nr:hypothetical protein [Paracoccaceae bacterium]